MLFFLIWEVRKPQTNFSLFYPTASLRPTLKEIKKLEKTFRKCADCGHMLSKKKKITISILY